jgi:hypothetical protein
MTDPETNGPAVSQMSGPSPLLLAVANSAAATANGMARYGYGLLLPDIQHHLTLGVGTLGVIGRSPTSGRFVRFGSRRGARPADHICVPKSSGHIGCLTRW